jgi:hypothetical protein
MTAQSSWAQKHAHGPDDLTASLACSSFQWGADANSPKAVMHVPIRMAGKEYTYQLDTGADVLIPYGKAMHDGWTTHGNAVRIPDVEFGGMHLGAVLGYRNESMNATDDPASVQGTMGLDVLMGRVFVIDFPRQRVCLMDEADLPVRLETLASWTDAEVHHGHFFVKVQANGETLKNVMYDTGSSADTLMVDRNAWNRLTGVADPKQAPHMKQAQSWGKTIHVAIAPALGNVQFGKAVFAHALVETLVEQPGSFRSNYDADGVLGNAPFFDSIVILDLSSHARFGVIAPSAAGH